MAGSLLFALLMGAAPAPAQPSRLPPVDRCASDRSFAEFRRRLLAAIDRQNTAFVLAVVTDDIRVDFGGGEGREDFRQAWRLDRPETSSLWRELGAALRLGCARTPAQEGDPAMFWAPSLFVQLDVEDPYSSYVALPGAVLRSAPRADAPVVAPLDWHVLTTPAIDGDSAWPRVRLADGRAGYVRRTQIRSSIDYRAGFAKIRGRWRMKYFLAGD